MLDLRLLSLNCQERNKKGRLGILKSCVLFVVLLFFFSLLLIVCTLFFIVAAKSRLYAWPCHVFVLVLSSVPAEKNGDTSSDALQDVYPPYASNLLC